MSLENDFYREIVDKIPEGVAVCDSGRNIIYANKNFVEFSGFSHKELIGKYILDIITFSKGNCPTCLQGGEIEENPDATYQLGELRNRENKITCIRINQSKTSDNNIIYLVIPFSDIAFLNQAHVDFVSTVSHELRTPLTSIKGFADTLLSSGNSLNKEQQQKFISIIKSQVDRLTRLVENLLTVSKLEARKSKTIYKAVDLRNMVESILYGIQYKAKEHEIEVNILPNLPPVWADSDKLEQVLTNLVDNAVKYSKAGTTVNIEAGFSPGDTDMVEIKVKDQGFGIPQESISKIFTKFSRIDNPLTRQVQGTGLGLYITKSLVESMKGDISVKSSAEGSVFTVKLPAVSPELHTKQIFQENS